MIYIIFIIYYILSYGLFGRQTYTYMVTVAMCTLGAGLFLKGDQAKIVKTNTLAHGS
jgi:hypothetical protein